MRAYAGAARVNSPVLALDCFRLHPPGYRGEDLVRPLAA
jgi:hypothetical protein